MDQLEQQLFDLPDSLYSEAPKSREEQHHLREVEQRMAIGNERMASLNEQIVALVAANKKLNDKKKSTSQSPRRPKPAQVAPLRAAPAVVALGAAVAAVVAVAVEGAERAVQAAVFRRTPPTRMVTRRMQLQQSAPSSEPMAWPNWRLRR